MSHLNLKSLSFYAVAIGSVLVLFNVVSAHGEKNVLAPKAINGDYNLQLAENLPPCQKSSDLLLNIQQSGVYVNASLLGREAIAKISVASKTKLTLTGKLKQKELTLLGEIPRSLLCANLGSKLGNSPARIALKIPLVDGSIRTGELSINQNGQKIPFTAIKQKTEEQSEKSRSH